MKGHGVGQHTPTSDTNPIDPGKYFSNGYGIDPPYQHPPAIGASNHMGHPPVRISSSPGELSAMVECVSVANFSANGSAALRLKAASRLSGSPPALKAPATKARGPRSSDSLSFFTGYAAMPGPALTPKSDAAIPACVKRGVPEAPSTTFQ